MKERCLNCGHEWNGCPNCNNPTPDKPMEYSPQSDLLSKLMKTAETMSLNDERLQDSNTKYDKR